MKKSYLAAISVSFFLFLMAVSCTKEVSYENPNGNNGVPKSLSIQGVITDNNGAPMAGVAVRAGNATATTDNNGSFMVSDATFTTSETFVTAEKQGYFKGSRTFLPREGSNNFVRIQLLPKTQAGSFSASAGGTVNVGQSMVTFSPGSIQTASGAPYSGTVNIKAAYLDPTNPAMNERMPGDLRGIRTTGEMRGLRTLGMMSVELEDGAGNAVQLRPGTTAMLDMPVPASLSAVAPANVPLWYFDEALGIWKEEGNAVKTGSRYRGTVNHFTFWNVDVPYEFVHLDLRVVSANGSPLPGMEVKLTALADSTQSYDYTDGNGYVDGYVPKNTTIRREILDDCNNVVSTALIGPFTADVSLGNVVILTMPGQQTLSGTVVNCTNLPVANGNVIITMPGRTLYANVVNGNFSVIFSNCTGATSASVIAVDHGTQQQSTATTVNFTGPVSTTGVLQACGTSSATFFTLTVDGTTRTWNTAPYELIAIEDTTVQSGTNEIQLAAWDTINGNGPILFLYRPAGPYTVPFNGGIISMEVYDPLAAPNMIGDYYASFPTPVPVFTEYGPIGQFIAGNFQGAFIRNTQTTSDTVNVVCSFKMRRVP